jgi:hypothetical protein
VLLSALRGGFLESVSRAVQAKNPYPNVQYSRPAFYRKIPAEPFSVTTYEH